MPQLSKKTALKRKPALLIDCFSTISNRHYIWYTLEVFAYRLKLRRTLRVVAPDVVPILRALKEDYVLVFFSNSYHPWMYAGLRAQGLDAVFDKIVISSEVHMRKPNPKIFRYVLDLLGYEPQECTLIDNSHRNNRVAAQLGIKTMPFKSQTELYKTLQNL